MILASADCYNTIPRKYPSFVLYSVLPISLYFPHESTAHLYACAGTSSVCRRTSLKTRLILKPGQRGTKTLAAKYGVDLLCVRFRYDAKKRERLKTVELVVERTPWSPPKPEYADDQVVLLRIRVEDMPARSQAKAAGGRWDPEKRLWKVKYGRIAGTPLEKHIYVDASSE